jgi:hypothetical protein
MKVEKGTFMLSALARHGLAFDVTQLQLVSHLALLLSMN